MLVGAVCRHAAAFSNRPKGGWGGGQAGLACCAFAPLRESRAWPPHALLSPLRCPAWTCPAGPNDAHHGDRVVKHRLPKHIDVQLLVGVQVVKHGQHRNLSQAKEGGAGCNIIRAVPPHCGDRSIMSDIRATFANTTP